MVLKDMLRFIPSQILAIIFWAIPTGMFFYISNGNLFECWTLKTQLKAIVAQVEGYPERESVSALTNAEIAVHGEQLGSVATWRILLA